MLRWWGGHRHTHARFSLLASSAYVISVAPLLHRHLALLLDLQKLVSPEKTESLNSVSSRAPIACCDPLHQTPLTC